MKTAFLAGTKGKEGENLNRMILLSLLIHAFVLGVFLLSPSLPAKKWTFGPVYQVDLVSLPAGYLEKQAMTPISKEVATIGAKEHSTAMKKAESLSIPPIRRLAPVKKETNQEVAKAVEGVRKKLEAATARQAAPREGIAETNRAMNAYYEVIWSRIKAEWALPKGILPTEDLEAVIDVSVSRSGSVTSFSVEKSSGNRYFDQSTVRAIRKASPFPPIPEGIRGSSIELGIRFHSAQFR